MKRPVYGQPRTMNYPFVIRWEFDPQPVHVIMPRVLVPMNDMCATEAVMRYEEALLSELCGPYGRVMP